MFMDSGNRIWCILSLKPDIWWAGGSSFTNFPENLLNAVQAALAQRSGWTAATQS